MLRYAVALQSHQLHFSKGLWELAQSQGIDDLMGLRLGANALLCTALHRTALHRTVTLTPSRPHSLSLALAPPLSVQ